jgi:hypothetical protein
MSDVEACCSVCNSYISVSHGGKSDLQEDIKTQKHQSNILGSSSSKQVCEYFAKKDTKEEILVAAAKLATAYKVIKHHQSFSSLDCSNKLHPLMYCDSKIAVKESIARTKATVITKNILAPHTILSCVADLQKTPFYGIATDASSHKAEKIFPLVIKYFSKTEGIVSKLICVDSLKDEISETVSKYCIDTLKI